MPAVTTTTRRITLKKLVVSRSLSEETTAFTADVYVDGLKVGQASNHGQGGNTSVPLFQVPADTEAAAKATLAAMDVEVATERGMGSLLEQCVDALVEEAQLLKDVTKFAQKTRCPVIALLQERMTLGGKDYWLTGAMASIPNTENVMEVATNAVRADQMDGFRLFNAATKTLGPRTVVTRLPLARAAAIPS